MGESSTASTARGGRRRIAFLRGHGRECENDGPPRICHCGKVAPLRTSWTEFNPGRRFFGCRNYRQGRGCGYFVWHDDEMGERPTAIINGLLSEVDKLYEEKARQRRGEHDVAEEAEIGAIVAEMKKNEMRFKVAIGALLATWVFIFVNHICS